MNPFSNKSLVTTFPDAQTEQASPVSPALADEFFITETPGKPLNPATGNLRGKTQRHRGAAMWRWRQKLDFCGLQPSNAWSHWTLEEERKDSPLEPPECV